MRETKLLFLFIYVFGTCGFAQKVEEKNILVKAINSENGLPQNTILSINQLKSGEMLFGTGNGLVLFNGINSIYPESPINKGAIRKIDLINDTLALVQTNNGVSLFNTQKLTFIELEKDGYYFGFLVYRDSISVFINNSILTFDSKFNKLSKKLIPISNNPYLGFHYNDFNFISDIGNQLNVFKWDSLIQKTNFRSRVVAVLPNQENQFYLALENGELFTYDAQLLSTKRIGKVFSKVEYANVIDIIHLDEETILCASSTHGMVEFNVKSKKETFTNIFIDKVNNPKIRAIQDLFKSKLGMIWMGTDGAGVVKYIPQSNFFETSASSFPALHKTEPFFITSMFYDSTNSTLWFGTHLEGLKSLNTKTNEVKIYKSIQQLNLRDATIRGLYKKDQQFFIGTEKGLFVWNELENKIKLILTNQIKQITPYNKNNSLLIFSDKAVLEMDDSLKFKTLVNTSFRTAVEYNNSLLLGAGTPPLHLFNAQKLDTISIEDKKFKHILIHQNKIWIATEEGIVVYSKSFKRLRKISTKNGLLDNFVYGIIESNDSTLWVSTNGGLARIQSNTYEVMTFQVQDGLVTNEFNTNAFIKLPDSTIYFGSVNGFVRFKDTPLTLGNSKVLISISNITSGGNNKFLRNDTLFLNAGENNFSMQIQSIDYRAPYSNRISYLLKPIDSDWEIGQGINQIRYSNLKPGEYHLLINAWNSHGAVSTKLFDITILVDGFFYEKEWFIIFSWFFILFFISMIIYAYFYRKDVKNKAIIAEQERLENERQRIAKDLHDDLGTGLSQIMMLNEMVKLSDDESRQSLLSKSSEISRNLIGNMNDLIWVLKLGDEKIDWALSFIRERISRIFESSPEITLQISLVNYDNSLKLKSTTRRHLVLILKELSHNTIKYAKANKVLVHIEVIQDKLTVSYSDDGIGFNWEQSEGHGNGLLNIKDRIKELKGSFSLDKINNEKGFAIHFVLPIY